MIQRIKLFVFYQGMAFASLWKPESGLQMILHAMAGSDKLDLQDRLNSLFSRHPRAPK